MDGTKPFLADTASFAAAVLGLQPFFDRRLAWSGAHLEHLAYRALRERHPELTEGEAYVLIVAARTLYRGHGAAHQA
jgi:hypothetical protein